MSKLLTGRVCPVTCFTCEPVVYGYRNASGWLIYFHGRTEGVANPWLVATLEVHPLDPEPSNLELWFSEGESFIWRSTAHNNVLPLWSNLGPGGTRHIFLCELVQVKYWCNLLVPVSLHLFILSNDEQEFCMGSSGLCNEVQIHLHLLHFSQQQ